jgi:hypothetical protein
MTATRPTGSCTDAPNRPRRPGARARPPSLPFGYRRPDAATHLLSVATFRGGPAARTHFSTPTIARISHDGRDQQLSRSATGIPKRERPDRLFARLLLADPGAECAQITNSALILVRAPDIMDDNRLSGTASRLAVACGTSSSRRTRAVRLGQANRGCAARRRELLCGGSALADNCPQEASRFRGFRRTGRRFTIRAGRRGTAGC